MEMIYIMDFFDDVEVEESHDGYFYKVSEVIKIIILGCLCGLKNVRACLVSPPRTVSTSYSPPYHVVLPYKAFNISMAKQLCAAKNPPHSRTF